MVIIVLNLQQMLLPLFPGVMLALPHLHWIQRSVALFQALVCGGVLGGITGIRSPFPGGIWCSFSWFLFPWPCWDLQFVYLLTLLYCPFSLLLLTAKLYPYLLYIWGTPCMYFFVLFVTPKTSSVQLQVFSFVLRAFNWKFWRSVHNCEAICTKHLLALHVSYLPMPFLHPHFAGTLLSY